MVDKSERYVSLLTRKTLALILAGGRGSRLGPLTAWESKPAVPFGGKFRIIDFPLSNCINSGIRRIGVLTQYKAHSLIQHLHRGWGFLRGEFDEFIEILPAQQRLETSWYAGTADAIYQNIDIMGAHRPDYVLILAGDHIYKMDYGPMIAYHVEHNADLTVGCLPVSLEDARSFGVMSVEDSGAVIEFNEKPDDPQSMPGNNDVSLASMGIYVFNARFLKDRLIADAKDDSSSHDFGKDIIPSLIKAHKVMCYPFRDVQKGTDAYWRDVGTVDAFWQANLELIGITPELNLYDENWPIWTYQEQLPPAKFVFDDENRRGMAVDSMVSGGCIISGALVRHSLLFSNVLVDCYSVVCDSVILPGVRIGRECIIKNAVIDRSCEIPGGMIIGENPQHDKERFYVSEKGVVLVTPDMLGQNWR
ncbi:MAG: glucose-1-phosphate adenylyltransferase [Gammaproteobacteria bacterium]|nr:glucose-1-phosphate adenylyltransferase [Gammaproteobacteria bacterium]